LAIADKAARRPTVKQEVAGMAARNNDMWGSVPDPAGGPPSDLSRRESQRLLEDELHKLPDKFRLPIILCYLQGKTNQEAADDLGLPLSSLSWRLGRARDLLRERLERRGLAVTAVALAALLAGNANAAVPAELARTVAASVVIGTEGHVLFAPAVQPVIRTLTEEVLRQMYRKQLKKAALVIGTLLAIGAGVGLAAHRALAGRAPEPSALAAAQSTREEKAERAPVKLEVKKGRFSKPAFSADGKVLAYLEMVPAADGRTREWAYVLRDLAGSKEVRRVQEKSDEADFDVALSPDGKKLALAGQSSIRLLDLERGKEPVRLADSARGLQRVLRFSRDGRTLGWSKDGGIALADVTGLKETGSLSLVNTNFVFLDDSKLLLSEQDTVTYLPEEGIRKPTPLSRHEFTYTVRDTAGGKELRQLEPKPVVVGRYRPAMHPVLEPFPILCGDGKTVVLGSDEAIQVCDWTTGKKVREFKPPWGPRPLKIACALDRPVAATSNGDRKIQVWDLAAGKLLRKIELSDEKDQGFFDVALSADGKTLVATSFRALADDNVGALLIYDLSATIPRETWNPAK
jgi:WD40 repeat protein